MRNRINAVCRARPSFTLIELLVVVGLIVIITAIGIVTIPLFQAQSAATNNSTQIVAWLASAKAKALSQQRATGIRLVQDPINPNWVRELQLVQTPDDYVGGMGDNTGGRLYQAGQLGGAATASQTLTFSQVDFYGGLTDPSDYPVQPGDYLEIAGGQLYQITAVQQSLTTQNVYTVTVSRLALVPAATLDSNVTNSQLLLTGFYTTQWRIIRQPRRVPGEDSLTLNSNIVIDFSNGLCQNVPMRTVTVPANPPTQPQPLVFNYFEILFAPNGGVVGRGTISGDRIILWVHDSTQSNPTSNSPVLLSVQVRTGFIGTYQVDTVSGDPYSFARDPRAGGM